MSTTWRPDPFKPEASYRIRKAFRSLRDSFLEGEVLKYKYNAYSIYDSMSGFFFVDEQGRHRSWDVHDNDSLENWSELFEEMP
jgi:hypothetical protein